LEDIRGVRADSYSVYYALAPDEIAPIREAARETVRDDEWDVIPLGNNTAAKTDELAMVVRAPDRRTALETAEDLWQVLAKHADIARGALITQIIDPRVLRAAA